MEYTALDYYKNHFKHQVKVTKIELMPEDRDYSYAVAGHSPDEVVAFNMS